jgi:hypothetical protein
MALDPIFTAQPRQPGVSNIHEISASNNCDPLNSFLGQVSATLGPAVYALIGGILVLIVLLIVVVLIRRRRVSKS